MIQDYKASGKGFPRPPPPPPPPPPPKKKNKKTKAEKKNIMLNYNLKILTLKLQIN